MGSNKDKQAAKADRKSHVSKDLAAVMILEKLAIGSDTAARLAIVRAMRDANLF